MRWRWSNQRKRLYLIISPILEIPLRGLRSDIGIFSHNLAEQIHLTIALSFLTSRWMSTTLTAQVSLAYSRTLRIQALYTCPLTFSEMPLFVSTGSKLWKFFQAALTVSVVASKQPRDWNHLNNGRSLLLQTYHFQVSLLDHLGKLWWCCWSCITLERWICV